MSNSQTNFNSVVVHRYAGKVIPVNAYLVETTNGVVVIDSTLTVSDSRALRQQVEALQKPLLAVLITHAHPDHYAGLAQLVAADSVPIIAVEGVNEVIRQDDALKHQIVGPMLGAEWPQKRLFPNKIVRDNDQVTFDNVSFTVIDLGPGESPHNSLWLIEDHDEGVFVGDLVYNHMHAYLLDGYYQEWLKSIDRFKNEFKAETRLYPGHGEPASTELLDWQAEYIQTFVNAVKAAQDSEPESRQQQVTEKMKAFLPTDDLLFLMQLSIEPMAAKLKG
jgi:glyoxylase-like metal-dependent hydrolase (beta-lactamase superfamily II)